MGENSDSTFFKEIRQEAADTPFGHGSLYLQAVVLARRGSYEEAAQRLKAALEAGDCSGIEALDLQARIHAQQGQYLQAEACWRQARNLDKENPRYAAALERLRRTRQRFGNLSRLLSLAVSIFLLMLLLWQVCLVNPRHRRQLEAALLAQQEIRGDLLKKDTALQDGFLQVEDRFKSLDLQMADRLATLATARQLKEFDRRINVRIQEGTAALEKTVNRQAQRLSERQTEALGDLNSRLEPLESAVAQNSSKRAEFEASLENQIDSLAVAVQTGALLSASAEEAEALRGAIQELVEALGRLEQALDEKGIVRTNKGKDSKGGR
ncbi:MAG: hypothetical protein R2940_15680 [Syntrophotaleaceae bacterium]